MRLPPELLLPGSGPKPCCVSCNTALHAKYIESRHFPRGKQPRSLEMLHFTVLRACRGQAARSVTAEAVEASA